MIRFRSFCESMNRSDRSGQLCWSPSDLSFSGPEQEDIQERAPSAITTFDVAHMKDNAPDMVLSNDELKNQSDHRATFDKQHKTEHEVYKFESNYAYNNHLRHNHDKTSGKVVLKQSPQAHEEFQHNLKAMDHITSRPTTEPMSTYRGFNDGFRVDHLKPGTEFTDHGYTGTSLNKETASGFAGHNHEILNHAGIPFKTIAKINVPPGTKAHYMDHPDHVPGSLESFRTEHEVTLQRGTRFRVKSHSLHHDKATGIKYHITHMDVIGQHPTEVTNNKND